jgi:hypothetical protein
MGKCYTGTFADANVPAPHLPMKALLRTVEVERAIWLSSQKPKRTSALQKLSRDSLGFEAAFSGQPARGLDPAALNTPGPSAPPRPCQPFPFASYSIFSPRRARDSGSRPRRAKFTTFLRHNYVKNGALPPGHAWPPLAWQTRASRSTLLPDPKGLNSTHLYVIII